MILTSGQKQTPELLGTIPHHHTSTMLAGVTISRRAHTYGVVRQRSGWAACELFEVLEGSDKGAKWYFAISRQVKSKKIALALAWEAISKTQTAKAA